MKTILNAFSLVKGGTSSLFSLPFVFHAFLPSILAKWNENCGMARKVSKLIIIYFVFLCYEVCHPECFEDLWMCAYSEACRVTEFFLKKSSCACLDLLISDLVSFFLWEIKMKEAETPKWCSSYTFTTWLNWIRKQTSLKIIATKAAKSFCRPSLIPRCSS